MKAKTVAIDQDQVLADLLKGWIDINNRICGDTLDYKDIDEWDVSKFTKNGKGVYKVLSDPSIYDNVPVIPHSVEAVGKMQEVGYDVFVVTSANNNPVLIDAKLRWLGKHFSMIPKKNIIFCDRKGFINMDYLIDDKPENLKDYNIRNPSGTPILFHANHNKDDKRYLRATSWGNAIAMMGIL